MEDRQVVRLLNLGIITLAMIAMLGFTTMSIREWSTGAGCPKIVGIPVCYLLTPFAIILIVSQLTQSAHSKLMFWVGLLVPWTISLGATLLQLNGLAECPNVGPYPACYLVLALFSSIILFNRIRKNYLQE